MYPPLISVPIHQWLLFSLTARHSFTWNRKPLNWDQSRILPIFLNSLDLLCLFYPLFWNTNIKIGFIAHRRHKHLYQPSDNKFYFSTQLKTHQPFTMETKSVSLCSWLTQLIHLTIFYYHKCSIKCQKRYWWHILCNHTITHVLSHKNSREMI